MADVSWSAWSRYDRMIEREWIGCPSCGGATRWLRELGRERDGLLWSLLVSRFLCLRRLAMLCSVVARLLQKGFASCGLIVSADAQGGQ